MVFAVKQLQAIKRPYCSLINFRGQKLLEHYNGAFTTVVNFKISVQNRLVKSCHNIT